MLGLVRAVVLFSWTTCCVREQRVLYWAVNGLPVLVAPTVNTEKTLESDVEVRYDEVIL